MQTRTLATLIAAAQLAALALIAAAVLGGL